MTEPEQENRRTRKRRADDVAQDRKVPSVSERSVITSKDLKGQLRVLIALTVIMYVVVGLLIWQVWVTANSNTKSLCALRNQDQAQIDQAQTFLKQHPYGAFGISRAQFQQSISNSVATVTALKDLGAC